jgi:RNA polymerase sigma factor (sigma-70 family)
MQFADSDKQSLEINALWNNLQKGDAAALERLMRLCLKEMFHYGTKFSADDEFIKDCIQDVFLEIWQRRDGLGETPSAKAYLFASLRRRMYKLHLQRERLFGNNSAPIHEDFDVVFSPENQWIEQELVIENAQKISTLLNQLSKREKEIVYLKFYQNLSRTEIAEVMNLNQQSVSNLLQTTLQKMRRLWVGEFSGLMLLLVQMRF